ncbi:hypothetical protein [Clostridium sp.]|uniref:hypothetical protein n=1 Tax=Clostridium sp. TaxID=1506 RepID=UPI002620272C|nr:hypothetical protein [Clostridium sp.]
MKFFKITFYPIILSFLIIGSVPNFERKDSIEINKIESEITESNDFIQNGIRLEYETLNSVEDERSKIEKNINNELGINVEVSHNTITYKDSLKEIKIIIWEEEKINKVQISYLNQSKNKSILNLEKEVNKIKSKESKNYKYFLFTKVKIIDEESYEIIKNNINKESIQKVDIYNGSTLKGITKSGTRINVGYISYDTGEYLIVGSPIIFETY